MQNTDSTDMPDDNAKIPERRGLAAVLHGFRDPVVWALGITQTIGYGTLFYAFGVLADPISQTFGLSIDQFFLIMTASLLIGGLAAPFAGRAMDHYGARRVMLLGSCGAALALGLCSQSASTWQFAVSFALAECMACMVLYEAAFAALTQIFGQSARSRMSAITLVAGFASTVFWPLTVWLSAKLGWSTTMLIFASTHIIVCLPLHAFVLPRYTAETKPAAPTSKENSVLEQANLNLRRRNIILFTIAICVSGIVYSAFPVHMLRIISNQGFSPEGAALVAMIMGPSQVLARIIETVGGHRFDALVTGRMSMLALVASCFVLLGSQGWQVGAFVFAALYGISQGLVSIARGAVPLLLFGTQGYGTLMGRVTGLRFILNAFGPYVFGWLAIASSVTTAVAIHGVAALLACGAMFLLRKPQSTS